MKKSIKKLIISLLVSIIVITVSFILSACMGTDADENISDDVFGRADNSIFDEYIYRSNNISSREFPSPVSGLLIHEENIVY